MNQPVVKPTESKCTDAYTQVGSPHVDSTSVTDKHTILLFQPKLPQPRFLLEPTEEQVTGPRHFLEKLCYGYVPSHVISEL